jgi:hypothetical protein
VQRSLLIGYFGNLIGSKPNLIAKIPNSACFLGNLIGSKHN